MRLLVFGTGVIGSTIGWQLQKNNDITHFVRSNKIRKLESEGILIQCTDLRNKKNPHTEVAYRPDFICSLKSITDYDACFVSVKSNQLVSILKEYQNDLLKIPIIIMQNIGLYDYEVLMDMFKENLSFAYPFIMGGGRENNSIKCTIFNSPINKMVFGNLYGRKNRIEEKIIDEFHICKLKPVYSHNIAAYLKLHYVWATCVLVSYIDSGSYERFIRVGEISKSYKAMVECFRAFQKEKINSRVIFPYSLYHFPAVLLGLYSRTIYNTEAMENMIVGHISNSPDEMQIMYNSLVEYCGDGLEGMNKFKSYIPAVNRYFDQNQHKN